MTTQRAWLALAFALLAPAAALAHEYEAGAVTVSHPWARATPGGATVGAAYVRITAKDADTLMSASSPAAARVEIHSHTMDGNVMKMRKLDALPVPAGGSAVLQPSGDHIMLFDLKAPLKEGDLLPITLVFAKAGPIQIDATVEPVGAMGPHGMAGQPQDSQPAAENHSQHNHN